MTELPYRKPTGTNERVIPELMGLLILPLILYAFFVRSKVVTWVSMYLSIACLSISRSGEGQLSNPWVVAGFSALSVFGAYFLPPPYQANVAQLRTYWPWHLSRATSGILIGWTSEFEEYVVLCVVTLLPFSKADVIPGMLEVVQSKFGSSIRVLGALEPESTENISLSSGLNAVYRIAMDKRLPYLARACLGEVQLKPKDTTMVFYRRDEIRLSARPDSVEKLLSSARDAVQSPSNLIQRQRTIDQFLKELNSAWSIENHITQVMSMGSPPDTPRYQRMSQFFHILLCYVVGIPGILMSQILLLCPSREFTAIQSQIKHRCQTQTQCISLLEQAHGTDQFGIKILLNSCLTLVIADVLAGVIVFRIIVGNPRWILRVLHRAYVFLHIDVLMVRVNWLMDFPAGFKLNQHLNAFIGSVLLTIIGVWNEFTSEVSPLEPHIITAVGILSFGGLSLAMALVYDIFNFCTLHIFYIYVVVARLLRTSLHAMASLFHLFRGKKWNVVRKRVDSAEFQLEHLIIGAVLFTILLFLLPTVFVFYLCFTLIWMLVVGTQCVLKLVVSFLNHFPLYLVILHFTDSTTLNGGINLKYLGSEAIGTKMPRTAVWLEMHAFPLTLGSLVTPYVQGIRETFGFLNPLYVMQCLATGEVIHLQRRAIRKPPLGDHLVACPPPSLPITRWWSIGERVGPFLIPEYRPPSLGKAFHILQDVLTSL